MKESGLVRTLKKIRKPFAVWPLIAALIRPARALAGLSRNGTIKIDRLKKPIPVYTLFFVLLIGVAGGAYASSALIHGTLSADSNAPDFTVALTPASLTVNPGSVATFTIKLSSLYSFAGSVNLNATIPSKVGATLAVHPNSVSLLTGTGSSTVTVFVPSSASTATFGMTLTGYSGRLSHSVEVFLLVALPPPPDFTIMANSSYLILSQGSSATTSLTLSSVSGFSALVNVTATVSPMGPVASLNPTKVALTSGGTANSLLSVSTSNSTPRRGYTVIVLATSGTFSHTLVISLTVQ